MKTKIIFILLATCSNILAQNTRTPVATLKFELSPRGHILVPIQINDSYSQKFVFDTGASVTALNEPRVPDGTLEGKGFKPAQLNRAHTSRNALQVEMSSMELAGLRQENIMAVLMDISDVEAGEFEAGGVLGYNFFGDFDIKIDYSQNILTFYNQTDNNNCEGVPFEMVSGTHIKFPLSFGTVEIPAILDTGSPRTGMNSFAADTIFPGATQQLLAAKKTIPSNSPHNHSDNFLGQLGIGSISVGHQMIAENRPTNVINLPVFEAFGMGSSPGVLVGADLLKNSIITIDYSCQKLSFG